jgi:hypothetical protein
MENEQEICVIQRATNWESGIQTDEALPRQIETRQQRTRQIIFWATLGINLWGYSMENKQDICVVQQITSWTMGKQICRPPQLND